MSVGKGVIHSELLSVKINEAIETLSAAIEKYR
jgi:hypothetical protein